VHYSLHPEAKILPKICNASNGLDIPLQENVHFKPYEIKKVNLKIKFQFPKHHCALLMNKSSARTVFNINVQLGLIDVGYHDYVIAVLQNMSEEPNILYAGTAVAQLLLLPAKILMTNGQKQTQPEVHSDQQVKTFKKKYHQTI
jgi:dUTPase